MLIILASLLQTTTACSVQGEETSIVFNQTGFEGGAAKWAILRSSDTAPQDWRLVDDSGAVRAQGRTRVFGSDPASGDHVHQIDFSGFDTIGRDYRIEVCGQTSRPFPIRAEPYNTLAEDALRYFYLNRLGTEIEDDFSGGSDWARAGGFYDSAPTCFYGTDTEGTEWPGCDYRLETNGGWGDAGDYGQYVVNGGISVWTLQYTHERLSRSGAAPWSEARLPLPESGNGAGPILNEARWHLDWMLSMQIPDGANVWVDRRGMDTDTPDLQLIDGSGLVHHKLHERAWLPLPILPEDADETRYLYPPSTAATLNLAAAAAQASRLWRELDEAYATRLLNAATRAFEAALREPALFARNNFDGGGPYGDLEVSDEFFWAATELFLTSRDPAYLALIEAREGPARPVFWANTEQLADLSMALHGDAAAAARLATIAETYLSDAAAEGYHYPMPAAEMTWGSNANLLNRGLILASAYDVTRDARYRDGTVHALDYVLGRNALDQSYVTGHGVRTMQTPHHRYWARGADPEYPPAPPGALSGGANHRLMVDPIAREMEGQCAPQRCWADDVDAYALNEVAINWNAPLFALTVFLESTPPD